MNRRIQSALISVFYKDGLEPIVRSLHGLGVAMYSTGGTQTFIESLGIPCTSVESVTSYPSILGGRVKTLHPKVFGGILARRNFPEDQRHVSEYEIPLLDLVIVDLYPFEETLAATDDAAKIIEKIDIGGVSLIRAAGKNFKDVCIVASRNQYAGFQQLLDTGNGETTLEDRRRFAAAAFSECAHYDVAIADYFNRDTEAAPFQLSAGNGQPLRYGENPHQQAAYYGDIETFFKKLNGKELSFNNLVDTDAACQLISEFGLPPAPSQGGGGDTQDPLRVSSHNTSSPLGGETGRGVGGAVFAIIKHTNVCGIAIRDTVEAAWEAALEGDKESAFGGVLATNRTVTKEAAAKINEIFFEILVAPGFEEEALDILRSKKNRILLQLKKPLQPSREFKRILDGVLVQNADTENYQEWNEAGARPSTEREKGDLLFANIICKHLKSNAIALVKDGQLIGKGCGQTSRIDALRQSLDKAAQFGFFTEGAVLASDAFFPFDDSVRKAHEAGITAIIQPGGSVRDNDSIQFCKEHDMAMVLTGVRHFRH